MNLQRSYMRSLAAGFVLRSAQMPEVEKKFRLPAVPAEILAFSGVPVVQGYVFCDPAYKNKALASVGLPK